MNLTIDIGNTLAKIGVFRDGTLIDRKIIKDWAEEEILSSLTNQNAQNVILSNVSGFSLEWLITVLDDQYNFFLLDERTPLPINNLYHTPETLGKDRIAAVVGASTLFPGKNALVIDAGTCITYEILCANGDYLGGNISPGLSMRLKAMHHFTGKLPLYHLEETTSFTGKNTREAMLNGTIWGAALEMNGFIYSYMQDFEGLNVLLTGGDAVFFAKKLKNQIFVDQNLVLKGLNKILDYNVSQKA